MNTGKISGERAIPMLVDAGTITGVEADATDVGAGDCAAATLVMDLC